MQHLADVQRNRARELRSILLLLHHPRLDDGGYSDETVEVQVSVTMFIQVIGPLGSDLR